LHRGWRTRSCGNGRLRITHSTGRRLFLRGNPPELRERERGGRRARSIEGAMRNSAQCPVCRRKKKGGAWEVGEERKMIKGRYHILFFSKNVKGSLERGRGGRQRDKAGPSAGRNMNDSIKARSTSKLAEKRRSKTTDVRYGT